MPPAEIDEGIFAVGGLGTIRANASDREKRLFESGREVALRRFDQEEGLGPRFNVTFCTSCHEKPDVGGSAPRYRDFFIYAQQIDSLYIMGDNAGIVHSYQYGEEEGRPRIDEQWNIRARRNAIPFFGVGALAEIDEESILANADPDDEDGDGISGRPNYDRGFVGRFGRKAQTVSLEGFIRGPMNNHLGITSDPLDFDQRASLPVPSVDESEFVNGNLRIREQGQAAAPASPLTDEDNVPDPELSSDDLFDLVAFAMLVGAPRPDPETEQTRRGKDLFSQVGCDKCHVPALEGPRGLVPAYSDLLLHDMGDELADGLQMERALGNEFRTQPLWGVIATGPYLHDGRAETIEEAIQWHGGEAAGVLDAYNDLTDAERDDIFAFLESLGGKDQVTSGLRPADAPTPAAGMAAGPQTALSGAELARYEAGLRIFDRDFGTHDGLGPFLNGDSCRACHFDPTIGGAGPLGVNVMRHGSFDGESFTAPERGTILPKLAEPYGTRPEHTSAHNVFEMRQTPTTFGIGLINRISEDAIIAQADPDDEDEDGISGRAHFTADGRLGRFSWKGGVPSVREFARDAMSNEMGITVPDEPNQTFGFLTDADDVQDPEITSAELDDLTFFLENIGAPVPIRDVPAGRAVFDDIGCAACHTPELPTNDGEMVPLYSDLLLHAVARPGQPGIVDGMAQMDEFRTPPLWGLSATAPYMHDGSAADVEEAILFHDGEAVSSRMAFEQLSASDRDALIEFLENL